MHKTIKPVFRAAVLLTSFSMLIAGCSGSGSSSKEQTAAAQTAVAQSAAAQSGTAYKITLVEPLTISLFQDMAEGAREAAKVLGVDLTVTFLQNYTAPAYISNIQTAIATKPDGMIFGWYSPGYANVTDQALNAGIKVVFANGSPRNDASFTNPKYLDIGFSGPDEYQQGTTLARAFLSSLPGKGTVLLINNDPGSPDHALRIADGQAVFKAAGYKTVVLNGSEDTATAVANVSAYLGAHPGVVGAYTTGFNSAQAVCTVAKQFHLHIPVASFDADPTSLQGVSDGCITVLVDQQFFLEGFYAVVNLWQSLKFHTQPIIDNTGTFLITKANVNSYPTTFP